MGSQQVDDVENPPWTCPTCRTVNDVIASHCDCGFNRVTGARESSFTRLRLARHSSNRIFWGVIALAVATVLWWPVLTGTLPDAGQGQSQFVSIVTTHAAKAGALTVLGLSLVASNWASWRRYR